MEAPVQWDYYERCVTSEVMRVEQKALQKETVQGTKRQTEWLGVSTGQLARCVHWTAD